MLKLVFTNLIVYPLCFIFYLVFPLKKDIPDTSVFFGLSVNFDKDQEMTSQFIDDLGVSNLLIRFPMSEIDNIQEYVSFVKKYKNKKLLINILQDRPHVTDHSLLKRSLRKVFNELSPFASNFQLGNAINRKKWAFFSMDEYLNFYKIGFDLRNEEFPKINLLGSSVIDFEFYYSIRTLFNFYKIRFDQFSSLLYVDRRGAPENAQMGLDLTKKLHLLYSIIRLSSKSSNEIVITETNWPITNTAPYAPTSENDCVSLELQADYLVRYYLLALASSVVKSVYWHQLIAPGYGLVDNRGHTHTIYPSYIAFKVMLRQLENFCFIELNEDQGYFCAKFQKYNTQGTIDKVDVYWVNEELNKNREPRVVGINSTTQFIVNRDGKILDDTDFVVQSSPIYLLSRSV